MIQSLKVEKHCIGCGNCERICSKNFRVNGKSEVISQDFHEEKSILEAVKNCPVQAIIIKSSEEKTENRRKVILLKKTALTRDVFEFSFQTEDFFFLPGQFVTFFFQDSQGAFFRSYSIVSATKTHFILCIKLEQGRGSQVLKTIQEGAVLECSNPQGVFVLKNSMREKVFIGTGTGIAPLIAMLQATPPTLKKMIIFGLRKEEDIFYQNCFGVFPNTKTILSLSQASEEWKGAKGRVTEHLAEIPKEAEIYICGNPAMVESTQLALKNMNHPQDQIFYEVFGSPNSSEKETQKSDWLNETLPIIQKIILLFSLCIPFVWFFPEKWGLLWDISWYSVFLLMMIRPLADIFPKFSFLRRLIPLRKELGILSASIVVLGGIFTYFPHLNSFISTYFSMNHWSISNFNFFAHMGELTGLILLITSNSWSQKLLKNFWKDVQRLSYVYFFSGGVYIFHLGKTFALYSMILICIFWFLAYKKIILWK